MFKSRDLRIKKNIHCHNYIIDDKFTYISVTHYIKTLFNEIYYPNKDLNKNKNIICKTNGNDLDNFIHSYFNSNDKQLFIDDNKNIISENIEFGYFLNFIHDNPSLKLFKQEWAIFDEDAKIAGSFDCILINEFNELFLYDWKRSKKIWYYSNINPKKEFLNFMTYKNNYITNCNYWCYALQVNFYAKILENKYNLKIKNLFITSFHPDNSDYINLNIPKLNNVMDEIWKLRKKES